MEAVCLIIMAVTFGSALYLVIDFIKDVYSYIVWRLIGKKISLQLVKGVIHFTEGILLQEGIKVLLSWKLSEGLSKYKGSFDGSMIVIYINRQYSVTDLVETTLHEIAHFIQIHRNSAGFDEYDEYTRNRGFKRNPFEYEAQRFAKYWLQPCLKDLCSQGIIPQALF